MSRIAAVGHAVSILAKLALGAVDMIHANHAHARFEIAQEAFLLAVLVRVAANATLRPFRADLSRVAVVVPHAVHAKPSVLVADEIDWALGATNAGDDHAAGIGCRADFAFVAVRVIGALDAHASLWVAARHRTGTVRVHLTGLGGSTLTGATPAARIQHEEAAGRSECQPKARYPIPHAFQIRS